MSAPVNKHLQSALAYGKAGLFVFPILEGTKDQPLIKQWGVRASKDAAQITEWWTRWPQANIGLACMKSGIGVVDSDVPNGEATLQALAEDFVGELTPTRMARSPRGGLHRFYLGRLATTAGKIGPNVDTRGVGSGNGGYVLLAPSRTKDGIYEWINKAPMAKVDPWVVAACGDSAGNEPASQEPLVEWDLPRNITRARDYLTKDAPLSKQGAGGDDLIVKRVVPNLKDMAISEELAGELMAELWNPRCEPPWQLGDCDDKDNLYVKIHNGYLYCRDNPPGIADVEVAFGDDLAPPLAPEEQAYAEEQAEERAARNERKIEAERNVRARPAEQRYTIPELCDQWVWIAPIKRFVNRLDPEFVLDKEAFNDRFQYLKGDYSSLTRRLFGKTEDTILKLKGVTYRPDTAEFTDDGFWNGWRPSSIEPVAGDTKLFHAHVAYLFPNESDQKLLLDWMAAVLQNPGTKPRHQLFIHGRIQRTGKTFFARLMRELLGRSNCQMLTQDILENGFTGWAMRSKLVWIEEVRDLTGSKKATSKLHSWASESTITINQKNLPTFVMDQLIAFMIFSNKLDALALDNSDGRYLALRTDVGVHPKGGSYYDALYGVNGVGGILGDPAALGAILYELLNRPLGKYSIEQAAPATQAKRDMIEAGSPAHLEWMREHDGKAPMRYRVKSIEEIVEAMPRRLQTIGASHAVRSALRDDFGDIPWETQIRPDGRSGDKVRVWLSGGTKKLALARKLTSADVLKAWREDRTKATAEADATAADDFAE